MRGLIVALLLGNIVYFVWQMAVYRHQRAVVYHQSDERELLNGKRLVLLSEHETKASGVAKQAPVLQPSTSVDHDEPVQAVASSAVVSGESNELQGGAFATEVVAVEPDRRCLYLGAFVGDDQRQTYSQRLQALAIQAQPIELEVKSGMDYWVHIKPYPTRDQALVRLRELQSRQIDSFIIPQGALRNGISLGVFDKRENAEQRLAEVAEKGYSAVISENQKFLKESWLILTPENSSRFSQPLFAELHSSFPNVEIKKDTCKGVAPDQKTP